MKPEISLVGGAMFNFAEPDPDVVTIEVIASAISKQCRFAGHITRFYSVAEHCVRGSYVCDDPLAFLLHDAAEAFIVDLPTPLKQLFPEYGPLERSVHQLVERKFGVSILDNAAVKHTDLVMLATEKRDLKPGSAHWALLDGIEPLQSEKSLGSFSGLPDTWERKFLERYRELTQ